MLPLNKMCVFRGNSSVDGIFLGHQLRGDSSCHGGAGEGDPAGFPRPGRHLLALSSHQGVALQCTLGTFENDSRAWGWGRPSLTPAKAGVGGAWESAQRCGLPACPVPPFLLSAFVPATRGKHRTVARTRVPVRLGTDTQRFPSAGPRMRSSPRCSLQTGRGGRQPAPAGRGAAGAETEMEPERAGGRRPGPSGWRAGSEAAGSRSVCVGLVVTGPARFQGGSLVPPVWPGGGRCGGL